MDPALAEQFAFILANWMKMGALFGRNADFYRDLLIETAVKLGLAVYVSDDGSVQDEPLLLKVPELVAELVEDHRICQMVDAAART